MPSENLFLFFPLLYNHLRQFVIVQSPFILPPSPRLLNVGIFSDPLFIRTPVYLAPESNQRFLNNNYYFSRYARISPDRFDHLLDCVGPLLQKKHCNAREPIGAAESLMLTIRYLASGESQQSLSLAFRIGKSTVCKIIRETTSAIWQSVQKAYVSLLRILKNGLVWPKNSTMNGISPTFLVPLMGNI